MPNYQNGCIYRITCKDETINDCYVGSTCDLRQRQCNHKSKCNNPNCRDYNYKLYQVIREHGGWDNWEIKKEYDYPCNDKNELLKEERKVMEFYNATLNIDTPSRTQKERSKKFYEKNKERVAEYYEKYKERYAEYREKNKEIIAEYRKEYREKNKERISKKNREKIQCECGCFVSRQGISQHRRSKKHQNLMNITP